MGLQSNRSGSRESTWEGIAHRGIAARTRAMHLVGITVQVCNVPLLRPGLGDGGAGKHQQESIHFCMPVLNMSCPTFRHLISFFCRRAELAIRAQTTERTRVAAIALRIAPDIYESRNAPADLGAS